jgi:hypothetical protein
MLLLLRTTSVPIESINISGVNKLILKFLRIKFGLIPVNPKLVWVEFFYLFHRSVIFLLHIR